MQILITGGAGFIGSHLSEFHINRGDSVIVVDNFITGNKRNLAKVLENELCKLIEADIVDFDFTTIPAVDLIYHLASPASPVQYQKYPLETLRTSGEGTRNVLEYAKMHKSRLVFSSTSEVYGDPLEHPQTESYWGNVHSFGPRACYDEGKRYAEALCYIYIHSYKVDIRIARIFNTYGPNMEIHDGRVVSNFITESLNNEPITVYGDGQQTRTLSYVSDMIQGLYKLGSIEHISGEIINLGNPHEQTVLSLAEIVKKLTSSNSQIIHEPMPVDDPKRRKPDITKAQNLLGWNPEIHLEEGLKKTIDYFKTVI